MPCTRQHIVCGRSRFALHCTHATPGYAHGDLERTDILSAADRYNDARAYAISANRARYTLQPK